MGGEQREKRGVISFLKLHEAREGARSLRETSVLHDVTTQHK